MSSIETFPPESTSLLPRWLRRLGVTGVLVGLYVSSLHNYLLFHSLVEIFSIVVAFSLFMIIWNSRRILQNNYLIFIGIAYLFVGFLDLLHTLSYKGMSIFRDYDYYANQLWIAARGMESLSLLAGFWFLDHRRRLKPELILIGYGIVTALLVASIFAWKIFPICFVENVGLTPFKKISEYVICGVLALCLALMRRERGRFEPPVYRTLIWGLVLTIGSELAFTFYVSNYGFSNLVGHYFKLFSFVCIYKAIVETAIRSPYSLIFRELKAKKRELENLASIDPATGVYNRRVTLAMLQQGLQQARRDRRPLALCFVDVDNLKEVNDRYGHNEGDALILVVVDSARKAIRSADYIGRIGGDEFLVVLPNCSGGQAEEVLARALDHLAAVTAAVPKPFPVGFSYGIAEYDGSQPVDIDGLIERADAEMYRRKRHARPGGSGKSAPQAEFAV